MYEYCRVLVVGGFVLVFGFFFLNLPAAKPGALSLPWNQLHKPKGRNYN